MAVFNPQVPETQAQDFSGRFKPVENPGPNKSTQIMLNTVGDFITGATKVADTAIKEDINDQVYAQVDKERDAYTSALEAGRAQVKGNLLPNQQADTGSSPSMSFADETEEVPPAVEAIEGQVNGLAAANKAGKINDTYYTQRLNSIAKTIRTQYPGYREYIDQKISQVTGMNPANAYYKNLMQDINQALAGKQNTDKQANSLVMDGLKKNFQGADEVGIALRNGMTTPDKVIEWYHRENGKYNEHEAMRKAREERTWNREDTAVNYKTDFEKEADDNLTTSVRTIKLLSGDTTETFLNKITEASAAGRTIDPQYLNEGVTALQAAQADYERRMKSLASKRDSQGRSYNSVVGSDIIQKKIDDRKAYFQTGMDQIMKKDTGSFYAMNRQIEGIDQFTRRDLLTSKDTGAYARVMMGINGIAPQISPILFQQMVGAGMVGHFKTFLDDKQKNMLVDPNASLVEDFGKAKQLTSSIGAEEAGKKLYGQVLRLPTIIGNEDPRVTSQAKLRAAQYAFAPKNAAVLDQLNMDSYVNGQYVPGKYAAFNILTAPQMTKNMWKLRQESAEGEQAWNNYRNWTDTSFTKLFRSDIKTLESYIGSDVKSIGWDEQNNRFREISPTDPNAPKRYISGPGAGLVGQPKAVTDPEALNRINTVIRRLNGGLSSVKEVIKNDNVDPVSYVGRLLLNAGMSPEGKVTGLPKGILDNIAASKLRQGIVKPEENFFQQKGQE